MAEDEEAQIAEDFGRMVRMITGSAMQVHESRARRRSVLSQQTNAEASVEAGVRANAAKVVRTDLYSREFWRTAGAESIADRLAVAAALGEHDPAAQSAWMHGADVLRSEYGIDLQEINRAHPSSLEDRHAATRDALDDYFAQLRQDQVDDVSAQARQERAQDELARSGEQPAQQEEVLLFTYRDHDAGELRNIEKDGALNVIENAPENLGQDTPEAWEDVKGWVGKDADVDRAIAEKFPDAMTEEQRAKALGLEDSYVDTAGVAARRDERREHREAEQDETRAEFRDDLSAAMRRDVSNLAGIEDEQLARVRRVQLDSFPREPQVLNPARLGRAPRKAGRGTTAVQERQEVLSR